MKKKNIRNNTYEIMLKSEEFKKQVIDNILFDKINKEKLKEYETLNDVLILDY